MSVFDRLNQAYAAKGQISPMNRKGAREAEVARGGIGENTKSWDALSTTEQVRRYANDGQGAIDRSLQAGVSAAMPGFQDELQGVRESAIRRGVDLGDIGTRNEGSLASAFQKNIANTAGGMAQQNYQTALDRMAGYRDWKTGLDNAKAQRRSAGIGAIAGIAGTVLGGPLGGAIGGKIGGMIGGAGGQATKSAMAGYGTADNLARMNPGVNMAAVNKYSGWGR